MCVSHFPHEAKAWRFALEEGNLLDEVAQKIWVKASQPILDVDDPFVQLMIAADDDMRGLAAMLAKTGNPLRWSNDFMEMLVEYHTRAHLLGQGGVGSLMLAQGHAANVVTGLGRSPNNVPEADFVLGFLNNLMDRDDRYFKDGQWDEDEVLRRMRMYQGKMRGSQGWGFVDVEPPRAEFDWVLSGNEDHCEDCPFLASEGPWLKETLYTTPGGGDTPCLYNCLCHLRKADGSESAKPVARSGSED